MITRPSRLRLQQQALVVEQEDGTVRIPLEDMAVLLIENSQVTLTAQVLSACADRQIAVITVDETHHPNGVLLAHLPHSRALKVMRAQLAMSQPSRKRLWQTIIKQKISNQGGVLKQQGHEAAARRLESLAREVRSGDTGNAEAQASQLYFPTLLGKGFTRKQERFHNAALDYGYAVIRAAIARSLVAYGFLTAFGLHHRNEQNAFNLADDLIEPFRPLLDAHVLTSFPQEDNETLLPQHKAALVGILHEDIALIDPDGVCSRSTLLAAVESVVVSLSQRLEDDGVQLTLPLYSTG
jgi:CRISPR-associated protein Cas1